MAARDVRIVARLHSVSPLRRLRKTQEAIASLGFQDRLWNAAPRLPADSRRVLSYAESALRGGRGTEKNRGRVNKECTTGHFRQAGRSHDAEETSGKRDGRSPRAPFPHHRARLLNVKRIPPTDFSISFPHPPVPPIRRHELFIGKDHHRRRHPRIPANVPDFPRTTAAPRPFTPSAPPRAARMKIRISRLPATKRGSARNEICGRAKAEISRDYASESEERSPRIGPDLPSRAGRRSSADLPANGSVRLETIDPLCKAGKAYVNPPTAKVSANTCRVFH
jgi:hypothetical protein